MDFILNLIPLNVMLVNRKERKILLQHLQVICTRWVFKGILSYSPFCRRPESEIGLVCMQPEIASEIFLWCLCVGHFLHTGFKEWLVTRSESHLLWHHLILTHSDAHQMFHLHCKFVNPHLIFILLSFAKIFARAAQNLAFLLGFQLLAFSYSLCCRQIIRSMSSTVIMAGSWS